MIDIERLQAARPLLRRAAAPAPDGLIVEVAAPAPGWDYLEVAAYRLAAGQSVGRPADDRERLVLVLEGRASACVGAADFGMLGSRDTVFDGPPPPVLLIEPGKPLEVVAATDALVVIAGAPGARAPPNGPRPAG